MEKTSREYKWVKWLSYGAMIVWLVFLGVAYKADAAWQVYKWTWTRDWSNDLNYINDVLITINGSTPWHARPSSSWLSYRSWLSSLTPVPLANVNATIFSDWVASPAENKASFINISYDGAWNIPACPWYSASTSYFNVYVSNTNWLDFRICSAYWTNLNAPTWYHWLNSTDLGVPPESCIDWLINQNETEVDYWGICGTCYDWIQQTIVTNPELGIDYGWRCEAKTGPVSYKWCEPVKQYVSGTWSTNLMFWYVTTPSVTYMYTQSWSQWYNNESVAVYNGTANRDIVELYNFQYPWAQVIQTWSIVFDWTTQSKIITPTNWNAQMFIMSIRSSNTQKFNFLKFWGAVSSISTVGNIDNHVWEVEFNVPWFWSSKAPLVMSWGVAVAYTKNGVKADSAIITFDRSSKFFQFSSFGIYSLSSYYSITNCGNGSYNCENVYRGNDTFACARNPRAWVGTAISEPWFSWATAIGTIWWSYSPSQYYSDVSCKVWTATVPVIINTQWDLTTVSGPSCIPNKTDGTLTTKEWYQIDYTTNGSGAVTSVNVKPIPFDSKVMCVGDEYDGFSWSLKCVLKFFFYYYDKMTWTQEDTMKILSTAIQVWYTKWKQAPLDITLGTKPNEKPTNALALAWYNAWDRTASGTNGISQTYRLWKYALYILVTVVVISMMFYFLNRKQ